MLCIHLLSQQNKIIVHLQYNTCTCIFLWCDFFLDISAQHVQRLAHLPEIADCFFQAPARVVTGHEEIKRFLVLFRRPGLQMDKIDMMFLKMVTKLHQNVVMARWQKAVKHYIL